MDYDTKLGEWFKEVERRAQELKARKTAEARPERAEPTSAPEMLYAPLRRDLPPPVLNEPNQHEPAAQVATMPVVNDTAQTQPQPAEEAIRASGLFEDVESLPVEDFLSFLNRSGGERHVEPPPQAEKPNAQSGQSLLTFTEGTGVPRPITPSEAEEEALPAKEPAAKPQPQAEAIPANYVEKSEEPRPEVTYTRFPQQLQHLLDSVKEEVAQHSYKSFKESRASLIQRLLDPPITLEETARILQVCPTTVRRYTNRGILKHFRTAGNQRRFRLSDVLAFLETHMNKRGSSCGGESGPAGPG